MIIKSHKYKYRCFQLLLILYLCGTFQSAIYEIGHKMLHLSDIVNLTYVQHSHDSDEYSVDLDHDHALLLVCQSEKNEQHSTPIEQTSEDKIEYTIQDLMPNIIGTSIRLNPFFYLETPVQLFEANIFTPPKFS